MDEKLGQILIDMSLLSREQLEEALRVQKETNLQSARKFKLGEILIFSETITLPQLQGALRRQVTKAEVSRSESVLAKKKERESEFGAMKSGKQEPPEDTFFGRLKSMIKSPKSGS